MLNPPDHKTSGLISNTSKSSIYGQLETLLAAGKWQEADQETVAMIRAVANRTKQRWLNVEDINNFPCEDLRTIDELWVKYSNGRFGFSVQKRIYQSLGGTRDANSVIWDKFGDRVGWKKGDNWLRYGDLNFEIEDPEGELPLIIFMVDDRAANNDLDLDFLRMDLVRTLLLHQDL